MNLRWVRWGVGLVAGLCLLVVLVLACLVWVPRSWYPPLTTADLQGQGVTEPAKIEDLKAGRLKQQNDARIPLVQGLSALLVLLGASIAATVTLRQVRVTREGQVTDRYTRAIDQLDEDNAVAVRLGGLFALERIARDSPPDRRTIAEVLCAYVRSAPRVKPSYRRAGDANARRRFLGWGIGGELPALAVRAADVQAALTILGRWQERLRQAPYLHLHDAHIQRAYLDDMQLPEAELDGAQLQGASLTGADLTGADLRRANLTGANLTGANLTGAKLTGANLTRVCYDKATTTWPDGFKPPPPHCVR